MLKKHARLSLLFCLISFQMFASGLNFANAFNLDDKFEKHFELLNSLSCKDNVFGEGFRKPKESFWHKIKSLNPFNKPQTRSRLNPRRSSTQSLKNFQEDCLSRLSAEKMRANLQPIRNSFTYLGVSLVMHSIMKHILGETGMASGFANMSLAYEISNVIKTFVESGYSLLFPKDDPLDELAKDFIKKMPFIPRKFWPVIINKFIVARNNQFEYTNATNFIKFALELQVYAEKPKIEITNMEDVIKELYLRIDKFFNSYDNVDSSDLSKLKIGVSKFVKSLFDSNCKMARYQYLVGPGGIGKTYFVKQLSGWINELIPNAVYFSDVVVNFGDDLEGSFNKPGLFLNTLRNQLVENKIGSIVFIDEFNAKMFVEPAKRTFNGSMSHISTEYFGKEIDGDGIKLQIPPMLIFVASNDQITDQALESRFNIIKFWSPKKESLADYAEQLARESEVIDATEDDIQHLRETVLNGNYSNFRGIEELVEPFIYNLHSN